MPLVPMRILLDHAAENNYGVAALNVNNMEQIQAIMTAAKATDSPVIIQASRGARSYTNVGDFRRADDAVGAHVAVRALGAADADGLVGQLHMQRLHISLRVDGQGLDAQFAAGADDAEGDFAAISDEDLLDHKQRYRRCSSTMPPGDQLWDRNRQDWPPVNPA